MKKLITGLFILSLNLITVQAQSLEDGLLYHYKLNNNLQDSQGNGSTGTLSYGNFNFDWFGNVNAALASSFSQQLLATIPHNRSMSQMNDAFTISIWVRPSTVSSNMTIISKKDGNNVKFALSLEDNGKINVEYTGNSILPTSCKTATSVVGAQWTNIAVSWDGTTLKQYVDGQNVNSCTLSTPFNFDRGDMYLGASDNSLFKQYAGFIDNIKFFDRTLAPEEIQNLYSLDRLADRDFLSLSDSLFMHLPLNNNDFQDISGNGLHAINNGTTETLDRFDNGNGAREFGDLNKQIKIPNNAKFNELNNGFTMATWVKYDQTAAEQTIISSIGSSGRSLVWRTQNNGTQHTHFNSNGGLKFCNSSDPVLANEWTHLTISWDGQTIRHFKNGDLTQECNFIGESINFNGGSWTIGNITSSGAEILFGAIDDIKIYNRTLTNDQIKKLYVLENGKNDLVLDFNFNENIFDKSPTGATATTSGFPEFVSGRNGINNTALYFNGINDNLSISPESEYRIQYPISLSGWIWLPDSSEDIRIFASNDHPNFYYGLVVQVSNGKLSVSTGTGGLAGPGSRRTSQSNIILNSQKWHHFTITMNNILQTKFFIDAVEDQNVTYSGTGNSTIAYDLDTPNKSGKIGSWDRSSIELEVFSNFALDEFKMWSRTLTENEVKQMYLPSISDNLGLITSLNNEKITKDIVAYFPNPSSGIINIASEQKIAVLKLLSSEGMVIKEFQNVNNQLDLRTQPDGIYILEFIQENGNVYSTKIQVSK